MAVKVRGRLGRQEGKGGKTMPSSKSDSESLTGDLPELPPDLAGQLRQVASAPFLVAIPETEMPSPPRPDESQPLAQKISSYTVTEYYTLAAYPVVVCYPPEFAKDVFAPLREADLGGGTPDESSRAHLREEPVAEYKLTADARGERFYNPLYCRLYAHYSLAPVKRTTSCQAGGPDRWELEFGIPGVGTAVISWYGEWSDLPDVPNLDVITTHLIQHKEASFCCPGYRWCASTGGCLDIAIECQEPSPA
jgi:hypothetical protein